MRPVRQPAGTDEVLVHYNRIWKSTQGTLTPTHPDLVCTLLLIPSIAAPAKAEAVSLTACTKKDASSPAEVPLPDDPSACDSGFGIADEMWRGSNQLLWMSKKHWSDQ
ncbi:MAG: hypothetical protein LQ343_006246 [Gyalolechia ehrenbergii]|nr:MAG: hypothetical protein LQ343_006246 [Gyalolechia ehrenbergii]